MTVRIRKSIKLGPGVRLTATPHGASVRVGGRGAGVSVSTSGRRTVSAGVPGSGVRYQKSWSARSGTGRGPATTPPQAMLKPGLLAPGYEKAFYKAMQAFAAGDPQRALTLFRESSSKDVNDRALADDLFVGLLSWQLDDHAAAIASLEKVVASEHALPDELMLKYVPTAGLSIGITDAVSVVIPLGSLAGTLMLAEAYQHDGRLDEAIGLLQQLVDAERHPFLILSLCDLYADAHAWDELVEIAAGTTNEDDVSLQIRIYQARAFTEQGMLDAALEAYKDALRTKKRNPELLKQSRYERARIYIGTGKRAQGRKELEKLYAEDSAFLDVRELLAQLNPVS